MWPGPLRGWLNTAQSVCPAPRQKAQEKAAISGRSERKEHVGVALGFGAHKPARWESRCQQSDSLTHRISDRIFTWSSGRTRQRGVERCKWLKCLLHKITVSIKTKGSSM